MAFNGSGLFERLYNWVNDKASGIKARADRMDAEMDGFATGLSTCITKNGQTTITANLPMATFRHTGVGNGVARDDYASLGQVQDGKANWAVAAGTADAITATYSPAITALVDGMELKFRASGANTVTNPTFSPNGLTARTITQLGGSALVAGSIPANLAECTVKYNLANTRWELVGAVNTLTATPYMTTALTKANAADAFAYFLPATVDFSGKAINYGTYNGASGSFYANASVLAGATFRIAHGAVPSSPTDGDFWTTTGGVFSRINGATKQLATTDLITSSPFSGEAISGEIAFSNGATSTYAHGLGVEPKFAVVKFICKTAEHGYSVGDKIIYTSNISQGADSGATVTLDATNVKVIISNGGMILTSKSTLSWAIMTAANWKIIVSAWK